MKNKVHGVPEVKSMEVNQRPSFSRCLGNVTDSVFKHPVACHIKTSMYNTVRQ
jgi:hypothetical protein